MPQEKQPLDKNTESYFRWAMLKANAAEFYNSMDGPQIVTSHAAECAVRLSNLIVDKFVEANGAPWATTTELETDATSA